MFNYHHLIFAMFPVLFIFLDNVNEIPLFDLFLPLFSSFLIFIIPWSILSYFIGQKKSALITTLCVFLVIVFAYTRSGLIYHEIEYLRIIASNYILIPIFGIVAIPIIIYLIKKEISSKVSHTLNIMSIVIFGFLVFQIGFFLSDNESFAEAQKLLDVPILESNNQFHTPNVYLILLDAYSGNILLQHDFEFDNTEFSRKLENRGFYVQERSFSNYPNTELSMPSIMNMNYLEFLPKMQGEDSNDMRLTQKLWKENKVMQVFEANGYEIYSFHGKRGSSSDMVTAKYCNLPFGYSLELMGAIENFYIPISSIRENLSKDTHYNTVKCVLDTMRDFDEPENPFYMHMHVELPHQPFVFDAEGNRVSAPPPSNRFDAELKDAYLQQLIFTNMKTLEIIDSIQRKNPESVIIVMSDHGGRFGIDWKNPSELDLFRGLNNFLAIYFPDKEYETLENISTVNIFRIFFNMYFNTEYQILDEKYLWYHPTTPMLHIDVTELIKNSTLGK
tara:strand:- start:2118 stop:3626 length:1509 start_codon:yes stop_codon:yes gene_type:complete